MRSGAQKQEILYGVHPVFEALKAGRRRFEKVLLVSGANKARSGKVAELARQQQIEVEYVDPKILDNLTKGARHQGIAAKLSAFPLKGVSRVLEKLDQRTSPCFMLILENIEDPRNFGALIRTALCAGVDEIFIPKDRAVSPTPSVSASSAGAMEHSDICLVTNTASLIRSLKEKGVWVAGLEAQGATRLYDADLTGDLAIVVGGEHKGIRPLVRQTCDYLLFIPATGRVNSLNASVAGGIALFEAHRQRTIHHTGGS